MRFLVSLAGGQPFAVAEELIDRIEMAGPQHHPIPCLAALLNPAVRPEPDSDSGRFVVYTVQQDSIEPAPVFRVDTLIGWHDNLRVVPLPRFGRQGWIADAIGLDPIGEKLPLCLRGSAAP
ncbi:MAG: hypothetical protein ACKO3C_13220 [Betaproteobacteria bacterium]